MAATLNPEYALWNTGEQGIMGDIVLWCGCNMDVERLKITFAHVIFPTTTDIINILLFK